MKKGIDQNTQNHNYIDKYWEVLAFVAWNDFHTQGRGAVIVFGSLEGPRPGDDVYMPLEVMKANPLLSDLARLAEEYDPDREVVVIFLRPPGSVTAYRGGLSERGTPREMYERLKPIMYNNSLVSG
jgi:hypothetical protein